jgi:single-stranded-DNA-specific exonuclease
MVTYTQKQAIPPEAMEELQGYSAYLQQLLHARGITTKKEAEAFLNPSYDAHLHDPFMLHDMEKAVSRIMSALANEETIAIYSDYDCDGIPGAVVLHDFFKAIGYEKFFNYIPHRHYEGFGLSAYAVAKLKEKGGSLIITIDCGTSDTEAVVKARELQMDVIITDHHEPKEELPEAYAVVNPKVGGTYPFDGLCGSGVVYKLVQALITRNQEKKQFELKSGWEKWWLDMVALATIADMVPLVGENRALAHYGLQVLRKSRRPGLQQLVAKQKANMRYLTEDDIGFTIGPRINAASRMDTPEDAFLMLSCSDEGEAGAYVEHLEHLNNERRGIVASMTKEINKRIALLEELPSVLVLGNPDWRPSLVGLVANKLAEEYKRPAFLWGRDGNGVFKGSCRSDGYTSVVTLMNEVPHIFIEHGGHHFSGGFGVREEHIHTFGAALNEAFSRLGEKASFDAEVVVDAELSLDAIDQVLIHEQSLLAPFGEGNPKPLYLFRKVVPRSVSVFGKTKEHMKLSFETTGMAREAIAFFAQPESFTKQAKEGEVLDLYAHIERSYFMGRLQTRLRIVDIV